MNDKKEPKLMNTPEAAEHLGIKESRLRTAVRRNELPFMRVGRLIRFERQHLDRWIESQHLDQQASGNQGGCDGRI